MQPSISLLSNATRKASKFLQRDFMELEMLQSSARSTKGFCNQSFIRTKNFLREELSLQFKNIIFSDEKYEIRQDIDMFLLVTPIEGADNLSKGLPFFATMITQFKKLHGAWTPVATVINFPALAEIYHAEKGGGSWLERFIGGFDSRAVRLRSSSCASLENAFICGSNFEKMAKISHNIRDFGSYCYSAAALFASGKIDLLYFEHISPFLKDGLELIIKESGGSILLTDGRFAAASYNLTEKFKQFLAKN